jgi:DNA-binding transcriptional LysR family regulator
MSSRLGVGLESPDRRSTRARACESSPLRGVVILGWFGREAHTSNAVCRGGRYGDDMDARRVVLFAEVLEHTSLTRAARAVHLSQPSLSRQIASLEREAGVRLINRTPEGISVTSAGEMLLRRAQAIRAQLDHARQELDEVLGLGAGRLRLAAFPTAAATLALEALLSLRTDHPDVAITIEERDRRMALDAIRTGRVDIALTFTDLDSWPEDDLLDTSVLMKEPMLVALPAGHPHAAVERLALPDLAALPWITGTYGGAPGLIEKACRAAGFEPRVVARLDHQPAIQAAVAARVGVTLIPALGVRRARAGIVFRRLASPEPVRTVLLHVLRGPRQPATDAGLVALRRAAEAHMRDASR